MNSYALLRKECNDVTDGIATLLHGFCILYTSKYNNKKEVSYRISSQRGSVVTAICLGGDVKNFLVSLYSTV
jgi:hypothetical protein